MIKRYVKKCENCMRFLNTDKMDCSDCCDVMVSDDTNNECNKEDMEGKNNMNKIRIEVIMKENNGWVPVFTDVFPDDNETVQITYVGYNTGKLHTNRFAYLDNGRWFWDEDAEEIKVNVIAWRPVPEPYISEEELEEVAITYIQKKSYTQTFKVTKEQKEIIRNGELLEYISDILKENVRSRKEEDDWEVIDENGEVIVQFGY